MSELDVQNHNIMTLIVAWAGLDCKPKKKAVASIYFAADSRYSWSSGKINDFGQKVFGCISSPEIFALCGDVCFPKMIIQKSIGLIDDDHFFEETETADSKAQKIDGLIRGKLADYDKKLIVQDFHIFFGTRIKGEFHVFRYDYNKTNGQLYTSEVSLPTEHSDIVLCEGTGKDDFKNHWQYYNEKNINHRTSRAVYQCMYETLSMTEEKTVGRIPQLVGLYRKGYCRFFGVINKGKRYYFGHDGIKEISNKEISGLPQVEWRNYCFEITDPYTMELKRGAQAQPFDKEATPFLSTKELKTGRSRWLADETLRH